MEYDMKIAVSILLVLPLALLVACSDDETGPVAGTDTGSTADLSDAGDGEADTISSPSVTAEGICFFASGASACLAPSVYHDGDWIEGTECTASDNRLDCAFSDLGRVSAVLDRETVYAELVAEHDVTVGGLALRGTVELPGATSWLSNGFQSWSQSGFIAIRDRVTSSALDRALLTVGDEEVIRRGKELSWFYTVAGGGDVALLVGALTTARLKPWVSLGRDDQDELKIVVGCGATGETVPLPIGERLQGESWSLKLGPDAVALLTEYGQALPGYRSESGAEADAGWNSWYELWDDVDETAVRENAALAAAILQPIMPDDAPPMRIVIDDGWQQRWGEWTPNDKFPSGLDGLAANLQAQGFTTGVWLAPLLVDEESELVTEHPDWFVGNAAYDKADANRMMILDVTHPAAAAHLEDVIERIVGWGYDFLKIDFLFAGTFEGERYRSVTGMEAYHIALNLIREAAGDDVILLAVGAPPLPSMPYVDAWRLGPDIALELIGVGFAFIANEMRAVAARWPMCWTLLCDADPPLLRGLPQNEVDLGAWVVAITGGAVFISDDLRDLDEERHSWGLTAELMEYGLAGEPFVPVDLFPADPPADLVNGVEDFFNHSNSHVVPAIWTAPDGNRVIININDETLDVDGVDVPPHSVSQD